MQLAVPGSAGTYTSAADRKLEEGQRVGYGLVFISLFFLLMHECVNSDFFFLFFFLLELVSSALGPEETWCGPAVW